MYRDTLTFEDVVKVPEETVLLEGLMDNLVQPLTVCTKRALTVRSTPFSQPEVPPTERVEQAVGEQINKLRLVFARKLGTVWCGIPVQVEVLSAALKRLLKCRGHLCIHVQPAKETWLVDAALLFMEFLQHCPGFRGDTQQAKWFLDGIWDSYTLTGALAQRQRRHVMKRERQAVEDVRELLHQVQQTCASRPASGIAMKCPPTAPVQPAQQKHK